MTGLKGPHGPLAGKLTRSIRTILLATTAAGSVTTPPAMLGNLPVFRVQANATMAVGSPITFGHGFAKGDVPAGSWGKLIAFTPGGPTAQVQLDQTNTWPDGSLRFAALSFLSPIAFAVGQVANFQLGAGTGALAGAPVTAAQLAGASAFSLHVSGYDYGADTFTVSANDVLASFPSATTGWGTNPLGGWQVIRSGPICTEWRVWRYLKRDSDGSSHRWVKAVMYVRAWSNGRGGLQGYQVLPGLQQGNVYGPHPSGTVGDSTTPHKHAGVAELRNGTALVAAFGGPNDARATTVDASAFNTVDSCMGPACGYFFTPDLYTGVGITGPGTPSALSQSQAYWVTNWGPQANGPGLADYRTDSPDQPGNTAYPLWQPSTSYGANAKLRFADGSVRYSVVGGTTGIIAPTSNVPGTMDGTLRWDVTVINSFGSPGTGSATIFPIHATYPQAAWWGALADGSVPWAGIGVVPSYMVAHDPTYLFRKTRLFPPYLLNLAIPAYTGSNQFAINQVLYPTSMDGVGDDNGDERIGYLSLSQVLLMLNPLDRAREKRVLAFGWSWADYQIWQTDERSGFPVNTGTSSTGPSPANPSFTCRPGGVNGNPAWCDLGPDTSIYQWAYGAILDASHLPSTWIVPYLRTGHAAFAEIGMATGGAVLASIPPGERNLYFNSAGYENCLLGFSNLAGNHRVGGWLVRALGTLDRLMADADPMRGYVRNVMDQTAAFSAVGPDNPDLATFDLLGLPYVSHTEQGYMPHNFMTGILVLGLGMEAWVGDRTGWRNLLNQWAPSAIGLYDEGGTYGGSSYFLDDYEINAQSPDGSVKTSVNAQLAAYAAPQAAPWPATGFHSGYALPPGTMTNLSAGTILNRAGIAMQAWLDTPVARSRETLAEIDARLMSGGHTGLRWVGDDGAYPTWAIAAPGS